MSDQWGPTGDGSEWARPGDEPAQQVPVEPELTLESEQAVRSGGVAGGRVVAGIIGVLVLLGGAVFAVTQLGSSGPGSPEEAVRELLDAASDEDVLGLLAALDPGEREALRGPVEDLFAELERLEVFSDDFELDGVAGIDIEFEDVELRSEAVRDDLVRVYLTGGQVTAGIDGDEIPLGDFVQETLERFEADVSGLEESDTSQLTDDGTFVVARNGSDGWRVSIGYTAAEYARLDAGLPLPAEGIAPVGAESPEAAVEGLFRAIAEFDLEGAIARLTPGELAALHDYAPLFLDQAQAALDDETRDVEVTIDDVELRSETDGDRGRVFVDSFAVTVVVEGDSVSVAVEDGCFSVSGPLVDEDLQGTPFEDGPVCPDELVESYEDLLEQSGVDADSFEMPDLPPFETPEIGISTARVDGEWYVAPVASVLDGAVEGLRVLEREHLEGLRELVEGFFFGATMHTSFEELGDPLDGDWSEAPDPLVPGQETTTTLLEPGTAPGVLDRDPLQAITFELAGGDAQIADCLLAELDAQPAFVVAELIDSWEYGYDPSQEVQDVVVSALTRCGG